MEKNNLPFYLVLTSFLVFMMGSWYFLTGKGFRGVVFAFMIGASLAKLECAYLIKVLAETKGSSGDQG